MDEFASGPKHSTRSKCGSGPRISLYEPVPVYQENVQTTGGRTTPDVSLVADPATGAWIADPYKPATNPFEVVGGRACRPLAGLAWGPRQPGRAAAASQPSIAPARVKRSRPSTACPSAIQRHQQRQQRLLRRGRLDLVTCLGTPVANLLVNDLVAYHGPGTSYSGPTVGPLQNRPLRTPGRASAVKWMCRCRACSIPSR